MQHAQARSQYFDFRRRSISVTSIGFITEIKYNIIWNQRIVSNYYETLKYESNFSLKLWTKQTPKIIRICQNQVRPRLKRENFRPFLRNCFWIYCLFASERKQRNKKIEKNEWKNVLNNSKDLIPEWPNGAFKKRSSALMNRTRKVGPKRIVTKNMLCCARFVWE